jgi:hypothetical protein
MYADDPVGFISRRCCEEVEYLFWQYWLIKTQCINKADRQKKMSEFDSDTVSGMENRNRYACMPDYEDELEKFYAIKSSIEVLLATLGDVSNYQPRE